MYEVKEESYYLGLSKADIVREILSMTAEGSEIFEGYGVQVVLDTCIYESPTGYKGYIENLLLDGLPFSMFCGKTYHRNTLQDAIDAVDEVLTHDYKSVHHGADFLEWALCFVKEVIMHDAGGTPRYHPKTDLLSSKLMIQAMAAREPHIKSLAFELGKIQIEEILSSARFKAEKFKINSPFWTGLTGDEKNFLAVYYTFIEQTILNNGGNVNKFNRPLCAAFNIFSAFDVVSALEYDKFDSSITSQCGALLYNSDEGRSKKIADFLNEKGNALAKAFLKNYGKTDESGSFFSHASRDLRFRGTIKGQKHMNFGRDDEARLAFCDQYPLLAKRLKI